MPIGDAPLLQSCLQTLRAPVQSTFHPHLLPFKSDVPFASIPKNYSLVNDTCDASGCSPAPVWDVANQMSCASCYVSMAACLPGAPALHHAALDESVRRDHA